MSSSSSASATARSAFPRPARRNTCASWPFGGEENPMQAYTRRNNCSSPRWFRGLGSRRAWRPRRAMPVRSNTFSSSPSHVHLAGPLSPQAAGGAPIAGSVTSSSSRSVDGSTSAHGIPAGTATASPAPRRSSLESPFRSVTAPASTNWKTSSPSWRESAGDAPLDGRTTCAPASPAVAAAIPKSRHSYPGSRHGRHTAVAASWRTNRCQSKSRSGRSDADGSTMFGSACVSCSAGQPISITSSPGEHSRTR